MTRFVLVRHGETPMNREWRYLGWSDPDLSPRGEGQAREIGRLAGTLGLRPTSVWSSDLLRARRTAELAFPGVTVECDARLREMDFGSWDGLTPLEAAALSPHDHERWSKAPDRMMPPGGETLGRLRARLHAWLTEATTVSGNGPLVVVTHGGPLRILVNHFMGFPSSWRYESKFYFYPGSLMIVGRSP